MPQHDIHPIIQSSNHLTIHPSNHPRQSGRFPIQDLAAWKCRLLHWADAHTTGIYLDSNAYPQGPHSSWECLVATGSAAICQAPAGQAFAAFRDFAERHQDWLFGFFGYDLKNEVERLHSANHDGIGLPELFFFQPETVAGIRRAGTDWVLDVFTLRGSASHVYADIQAYPATPKPTGAETGPIILSPRMPKTTYLATVEAIRQHIIEGDVYELNLCQEFFAASAAIEPCTIFRQLNALTEAPFAAYLRWQNRFLLCASPERFLRKEGQTLISQPIKGTRRRHAAPETDAQIRESLRQSIKDQAENVMIVDLVRNDLARHCQPGSVRVDELFGIYTFKTVHQMISTVRGTLLPGQPPLDALRDAFPMGSMTGAPKVMAMELIEQYEKTRRGLFSGAVGYFDPAGNFDFNVVIRSILYNASTRYLSCQVGGAIVYDSVPEQEYEECLVKAAALIRALGGVMHDA